VRQKYDQGNYGDRSTSFHEWRPCAGKCRHRKYILRHRGANGACRTRNKTERLDSAARRSNESADDKHQSQSCREKLFTATKRTPISKESEGQSKVNFVPCRSLISAASGARLAGNTPAPGPPCTDNERSLSHRVCEHMAA
jgi:hypothetical protein